MDLDFLTDQVLKHCDELAQFSEVQSCLTRTFLSPPTRQVHACLSRWMVEASLQPRIDAIGNLIGRHAANVPNAPIFIVGSHIDTVPDAGKYDGVLGVLLGIAAAQALSHDALRQQLDVIAFSEEEGVRFRTPYLGSMAVCGIFDPQLLAMKDVQGMTLAQAVADFGLDPTAIAASAYTPGTVSGFLEAHIEQGPLLESLNLSLASVDAIVGQSRRRIRFTGEAGHAGTSPMQNRRDALVGAAEFISAVERLARETPGLRATVGSIEVKPGAINVIPGEARLTLDLRHSDDARRESGLHDAVALGQSIARMRKLTFTVDTIADQRAVPCDAGLTAKLEASMTEAGHPVQRMASGAGHDAAIMAKYCPATMLFVRSPGGISHHPDESVRREDVRAALDVMIRFLRREIVDSGAPEKS